MVGAYCLPRFDSKNSLPNTNRAGLEWHQSVPVAFASTSGAESSSSSSYPDSPCRSSRLLQLNSTRHTGRRRPKWRPGVPGGTEVWGSEGVSERVRERLLTTVLRLLSVLSASLPVTGPTLQAPPGVFTPALITYKRSVDKLLQRTAEWWTCLFTQLTTRRRLCTLPVSTTRQLDPRPLTSHRSVQIAKKPAGFVNVAAFSLCCRCEDGCTLLQPILISRKTYYTACLTSPHGSWLFPKRLEILDCWQILR